MASKAKVFHGTATHTAGGLTKSDLKYKDGRIISKAKSAAGHRNPGLAAWREAKERVFPGSDREFVVIKKGTQAYKKVKRVYESMIR
jgi:hypothetical protein